MNDKEIILQIQSNNKNNLSILEEADKLKINRILCEPEDIQEVRGENRFVISSSEDADSILVTDFDKIIESKKRNKQSTFFIKVKSNNDIQKAVEASKLGATAILVETFDWKIIPLENLIAELHNLNTKVYTRVNSPKEIRTMFKILEKGVNGVVLKPEEKGDVEEASKEISSLNRVEISPVKVLEVRETESGERACIDTASILKSGEGMLIGSRSSFLFLIHNESVGSSFTSPRPFRVNAGAIHSYVMMPDSKTKYLSEVEAGDDIVIISSEGFTRKVAVGRVKIENRPLMLVKAERNGDSATVLVQNAETIRFVKEGGETIPVTELQKGDIILARIIDPKGRHFGLEVDEYILEK